MADFHTLKFTVAHALGFSFSTSRLLSTDVNTETITSNHYEVFLSFLLRSPWNADQVLQSKSPVSVVLGSVLHGTNLYATNLISAANTLSLYRRGTDTHHRKGMSRDRYPLLCDVTAVRARAQSKHFHRMVAWRMC
jgi:hypothetical protein